MVWGLGMGFQGIQKKVSGARLGFRVEGLGFRGLGVEG